MASSSRIILTTRSSLPTTTMTSQHHSSSPNLVGGHYRVGRKIGEGSFGVIFEGPLFLVPVLFPNLNPFFSTGTNLLNSQTVAIKFVSRHLPLCSLASPFHTLTQLLYRNLARQRPPS